MLKKLSGYFPVYYSKFIFIQIVTVADEQFSILNIRFSPCVIIFESMSSYLYEAVSMLQYRNLTRDYCIRPPYYIHQVENRKLRTGSRN